MSFRTYQLFSNGKKKIRVNIGLVTNIALKKHQYKESNLSSAHSLSLVFSHPLREVVVVVHGDAVCRVIAVFPPQNMVHLFPLFLTGGGQSTARMASSNTVFRPRWVSAEHSRYFTAPEDQQEGMMGNTVLSSTASSAYVKQGDSKRQ